MWMQYIEKRGPLHDGLRLEYLFARLAAHISQFGGNKDAEPKDFLRYHGSPDGEADDVVDDISEIAKIMGVKQVKKHG